MRKIFSAVLLLLATTVSVKASDTVDNYRRSSIYSILLQHSGQKYVEDVRDAYMQQPLSDKFNDHSLSIVSLETSCGAKKYEEEEVISKFLEDNNVAQRMVAKWFGRDKKDGTFDINMLMERGYYDASLHDVQLSSLLQRGSSIMADAGEDLISNTFVIVYDIIYIDKEENAQKTKRILNGVSEGLKIVSAFIPGGSIVGTVTDLTKSAVDMASAISNMISGFSVKINAHLYQLEWNDEIAATFYSQYYIERGHPDPQKAALWPQAASLFKLKYLGSESSVSAKTVARGLYSPQDVIRKVTLRAVNKSVADLQRSNEVFRVKVPISKVSDDCVYASIGMKEGVQESDIYEVLEAVINEDGYMEYNKVGTVKPVRIWDNRYMAIEEGAENADIEQTEFEIVSGKGFYPGMLLRQGNGKSSAMKSPSRRREEPSSQKDDEEMKAAEAAAATTAATTVTATTAATVAKEAEEKAAKEAEEKAAKEAAKADKKNERKTSGKPETKMDEGPELQAPQTSRWNKNNFFIMANAGYDLNATDINKGKFSFGATFAWTRHFGCYAKFRSSFCNQKAISESSDSWIWTDGANGRINYNALTMGAVFGVTPKVYFYSGLGLGVRNVGWYNYGGFEVPGVGGGGSPSLYDVVKCYGPAADFGMMFRFGHFSMMCGLTAIFNLGSDGLEGSTFTPELGIGVAF